MDAQETELLIITTQNSSRSGRGEPFTKTAMKSRTLCGSLAQGERLGGLVAGVGTLPQSASRWWSTVASYLRR